MARESERMHILKENFMEWHLAGFSIPEIASKCDLGNSTVYQALQEIADANNVSRESLLQIVRTPTESAYNKEAERVKVNISELRDGFEKAGYEIEYLINQIAKTLREENKNVYGHEA